MANEFESFRSHTAYLELARLHLANNELNAARFLLLRLINSNDKSDSLSRNEFVHISGNQTEALLTAAEICDQSQKADNNFTQVVEIYNSAYDTEDIFRPYKSPIQLQKITPSIYQRVHSSMHTSHLNATKSSTII